MATSLNRINAQMLLVNYGDDAACYATKRFSQYIKNGDVKNAALWLSCIQDIRLLKERRDRIIH